MNVGLLQKQLNVDATHNTGMLRTVLSDVPPVEAFPALLEIVENAEQKRRGVEWLQKGAVSTWLFGVGAIVLTQCLNSAFPFLGPSQEKMLTNLPLALSPLAVAVNALHQKLLTNPDLTLCNASIALLQFSNPPRKLLPFVDALHVPQTHELQTLLYPVLTERLWNLSPTDAALSLDITRRATLRNTLSHAYAIMPNGRRRPRTSGHFNDETTDLAVAIIKTLAGMGDRKTESVLRKIIHSEALTPNETVVRDAAREYLPVLTEKETHNAAMQKQLRERASEPFRNHNQTIDAFADTLPPEEAKVVLAEFLRAERSVLSPFLAGTGGVMCLAFGLSWLWICHEIGNVSKAGMGAEIAVVAIGSVFTLFGIYLLAPAKKQTLRAEARKIACELAKRSGTDTRLLALLLPVAQSHVNAEQHKVLQKALARLLPLVQFGDAALIPPAQRSYLRSWLKKPWFKKQRSVNASQTLAVAALDALSNVGDTKTLPLAEKIARRTVQSTLREKDLHEAAVRCVEALRARQ